MNYLNELTFREKIFLMLVFVLVIGYFVSVYAGQLTIKEFQKANYECHESLNRAQNGQLPIDGDMTTNLSVYLENLTIGKNSNK